MTKAWIIIRIIEKIRDPLVAKSKGKARMLNSEGTKIKEIVKKKIDRKNKIPRTSFLQPDAWVGFFPFWLRNLISENFLLVSFSIYQLVLAGWLLSGKKIVFAAELSGLTLLSIIVANYGFLDVLFRDIAILFSAIGLIALHWGE